MTLRSVWVVFASMAGAAATVHGDDRVAVIEVVPTTLAGEVYRSSVEPELLNTSRQEAAKGAFHNYRASVPYGYYLLRLRIPGFKNHEQLVSAFKPRVYVRVGLRIATISDEPPVRITGAVTPAPQEGDDVWIRAVPLLSSGPSMDSLLDKEGRFEFVGAEVYGYMLLVMRGMDCIATKSIRAPATGIRVVLSTDR